MLVDELLAFFGARIFCGFFALWCFLWGGVIRERAVNIQRGAIACGDGFFGFGIFRLF